MMDRIIPWSVRATGSFRHAVQSLLSLTAQDVLEIAQAAETSEGFNLYNTALSNLHGKLSTPNVDPTEILAVCGFLYDCVPAAEEAKPQLLAELRELAEELQAGDFTSKEEALKQLFAPKPAHDRAQKALRASRAGLPVLERIDFQCDLRAVVEQSGDAPQGWVPTIIARFGFDEPIAGQEAIVFQLAEAGLDELESNLRAIRETLNQTKEDLKDRLF